MQTHLPSVVTVAAVHTGSHQMLYCFCTRYEVKAVERTTSYQPPPSERWTQGKLPALMVWQQWCWKNVQSSSSRSSQGSSTRLNPSSHLAWSLPQSFHCWERLSSVASMTTLQSHLRRSWWSGSRGWSRGSTWKASLLPTSSPYQFAYKANRRRYRHCSSHCTDPPWTLGELCEDAFHRLPLYHPFQTHH